MPKNPHADFTPALEGYSGQGKFRFWCQMALPLTYDDSLSYYELLCKVVNYLNHTIEDVANAETNVSRLAEAYTQLQNYVNNYFDDLDIEAELRNVLDAMAEDGTLDDLLDPLVQDHLPAVVDEQIDDVVADQIDDAVAGQIGDVVAEQLPPLVEEGIPDEVSDWLTENVNPVGSAVVVDSSLTIGGAAADAKVTGDELANLKTHLSTIENVLETSYYYREGSGNGYGLSNWVHLIDNIDLDSGTTYKFSLTPESNTFSGTVNILISTDSTGTPASTTIQNTYMPTDGYEYNYTPNQDFRGVRFMIYAPQADVTVTAVVEEVHGQNAIERIDFEIDALDGRLDSAETDVTAIKNELDIVTNEWTGTQNPYGSGNWVKILENLTLKKDVTYKLEIGAASAPSGNISWVWNSLNTESPAWNPGKSGTLTSSDYQDTVYFTADQDYSGVRVQIYGGSVNVDVTAILTSDEAANSIDAVNDRLTNYGEIFKNIDGADYTGILSRLVRAIYIPDATLKGKLMLSSVYKASITGSRYIRLYAYVNNVLALIYESSTSSMVSIAPGLEIAELTRSGKLSGYALIDWNVLEDGATFSNLTTNAYVLSDYCYDIKFAPFLSDYFFWQNNYMGKSLNLAKITAGEVSGNVYEIPHNYDVPVNKGAFYLSSDIEEAYETDTDAKRIRSLIPYLYFNGQKIGTVVLFDDNGDPYIVDADGNTKHITVS